MVKLKGVHCPNCWKTNNGVEIMNDGSNAIIVDCCNCSRIMVFKIVSKRRYTGQEEKI